MNGERLTRLIGYEKVKELVAFANDITAKKGITSYSHNQLAVIPVSDELCRFILHATDGHTDVSGKCFAIEASKLYYEMRSHNDKEKEALRGQNPFSGEDIFDIVECMVDPDVIEDVSHGDKMDERNTFAAVKHMQSSVVVVLSVGGKRNPNVTPQQIIFFKKEKWDSLEKQNMTVREIVYGNNKKRAANRPFIEKIKKIELPWRTMNHRFLCPDVQNASTFSSICFDYIMRTVDFKRFDEVFSPIFQQKSGREPVLHRLLSAFLYKINRRNVLRRPVAIFRCYCCGSIILTVRIIPAMHPG